MPSAARLSASCSLAHYSLLLVTLHLLTAHSALLCALCPVVSVLSPPTTAHHVHHDGRAAARIVRLA